MSVRLAINGFGRIGRNAFKIALERSDVELVAVNDLANARILAHLLKYDSVYGIYSKPVQVEEGGRVVETEGGVVQPKHFLNSPASPSCLLVGEKRVRVVAEKDPLKLPWGELGIDVVLECTGRFTENGAAKVHLQAGAKKVVISAPAKGGEVRTYLLGVNAGDYQGEPIISNASCTTNCVSPVASIVSAKFGIIKAAMTTVHAYTAEQNLVDGLPPQLHEDLRRGRAAAFNISPTTTGAALSTAEVLPELKGLFDGLAVRVPVIVGSLSDFTFLVKRRVTVEEVNQAFVEASQGSPHKGIVEVTVEPLVSSDIVGSSASAIVDLTLTKVIGDDLVKVVAWYDNEWGYSNRLVEMAILVSNSGQSVPA